MLGFHVEMLGWLEIVEPGPETSLAEIVRSRTEIFIGSRLMARVEPVIEIPVLSSPEGVEGQVSFLAQSRTMMGSIDYVYLNRGTLDGIEIGSPLQVYRRGFEARERARRLWEGPGRASCEGPRRAAQQRVRPRGPRAAATVGCQALPQRAQRPGRESPARPTSRCASAGGGRGHPRPASR